MCKRKLGSKIKNYTKFNMNHNIIDVALIAAKIVSIRDEKARMKVGSASIVYNAVQVALYLQTIVDSCL